MDFCTWCEAAEEEWRNYSEYRSTRVHQEIFNTALIMTVPLTTSYITGCCLCCCSHHWSRFSSHWQRIVPVEGRPMTHLQFRKNIKQWIHHSPTAGGKVKVGQQHLQVDLKTSWHHAPQHASLSSDIFMTALIFIIDLASLMCYWEKISWEEWLKLPYTTSLGPIMVFRTTAM